MKEAAAEYRAALARAPNYAEAQANLGAVLAQLGNYDEALAAYEAAYRLKPELTPIPSISYERCGLNSLSVLRIPVK